MMRHAFAPGGNPAPELFSRYILYREYGFKWEDTGPPLGLDEIALVAEMANIWQQATEMKGRRR